MIGHMAVGKGNPVHVNEYLRDWIAREWIGRGKTATELAKLAGVDKTTISDFKNSKRGAGYDLASGIARVMGKSRDEVESEALAWWNGQGRDVKRKNDPHPNRTAALEFMRLEVPAEVLAKVRAVNLDATQDPSRAWWVARIMSEWDLYRVQNP